MSRNHRLIFEYKDRQADQLEMLRLLWGKRNVFAVIAECIDVCHRQAVIEAKRDAKEALNRGAGK